MIYLKRIFKRNSHNRFFKILAGFGRSLNRLYENRNHDMHSNGELVVIRKIAKLNPIVIIDGGANTGEYSVACSVHNPECTIFAFEPVAETYEQLKKRVNNNSNIVPVKIGLFSENCKREINIFNTNPHSSIYDIKGLSYSSINKETIELVAGDSFVHQNKIEKIDLLKLDLEGAEYDAILGFRNSLLQGKVRAVQFEFGYINISTRKLLLDYYILFNEYGYKVGKIFPKTVEFREYELKHEDFMGPNFIAVRKDDTELIELLINKIG